MSAVPKGFAKDQPEGFTNCISKVALFGAGGQVGKHLTSHLLATKSHTITAITRPDSTAHFPTDVNVIRVNYTSESDSDTSALVNALTGQQVVLVAMSYKSLTSTTHIVRAAAAAKVPYILPNWFGHDAANETLLKDSLMTGLLNNVREVERLGVSAYFLLACNFWYEFSLGGGPHRYGFDFKDRSVILYDGGEVAINTSTWAQCGRAVASLLSLKELPEDGDDASTTLSQFCNGCVYVSSFRVSQRDMFESVKRVTGTKEAEWKVARVETKKRYEEGLETAKKGQPEGWMKMGYSRMFFQNGDGDYENSRGLHNEVLNLPMEDLDECTAVGIRMGENGEVWP